LKQGAILMLKKFSISVLLVTFFIFSASEICFAELALVRLTVGGITLGAEMDWVKETFGEPTKIFDTELNSSRFACHEYGEPPTINKNGVNHLRVLYNRGRVVQVICDGDDNKLQTFDGVKLGDHFSIVKAVYGEPDKEGKPPTKLKRNVRADKYLLYHSSSSSYNLMFLTKRGKVVAIFSGIVEVRE